MSKNSEHVKEWRRRTKQRMVVAMGGKCSICDYDRSTSALEFHHLDPEGKEMGFGAARAEPKAWTKIVEELRKCVLLCSNCHREVHEGVIVVPDDHPRFNEDYADYRGLERSLAQDPCPVCSKMKPSHRVTCSRQCAGQNRGIKWELHDLPAMLSTMAKTDVAETVGCTLAGLDKRLRKLGLPTAYESKRKGRIPWDEIDLPDLMSRLSMVKIAEMLGCSDVAVKKRWKKLTADQQTA